MDMLFVGCMSGRLNVVDMVFVVGHIKQKRFLGWFGLKQKQNIWTWVVGILWHDVTVRGSEQEKAFSISLHLAVCGTDFVSIFLHELAINSRKIKFFLIFSYESANSWGRLLPPQNYPICTFLKTYKQSNAPNLQPCAQEDLASCFPALFPSIFDSGPIACPSIPKQAFIYFLFTSGFFSSWQLK